MSHKDVLLWNAGLELLDAMEEGALMRVRREHMGRSSTGMGKNAQVRCVAEGFQARLLFEGQVLLLVAAYLCVAVVVFHTLIANKTFVLKAHSCVSAVCLALHLFTPDMSHPLNWLPWLRLKKLCFWCLQHEFCWCRV